MKTMEGEKKISSAIVRRLPRYYRLLQRMREQGRERISSGEMAQMLNLNASQVRQDFNNFGGFGQQGYGYPVETLYKEVRRILGLDREHRVVIAGAGNIGRALSGYPGFAQQQFRILALFDVNPSLVGTKLPNGIPILHIDDMADYIRDNAVDVGVLAARRSVAQSIADTMVEAGVEAIWNFVPMDIRVSVPIENVHLAESLFVLSYRMQEQEKKIQK